MCGQHFKRKRTIDPDTEDQAQKKQSRFEDPSQEVHQSPEEENRFTERRLPGIFISTHRIPGCTLDFQTIPMRTVHLIHTNHFQQRPKPPVEQRVQVMDRLDREMKEVLDREDVPTDEHLKLHDQALFRHRNVQDDYRPKPGPLPPPQQTSQNEDLLENDIMESTQNAQSKTSTLTEKDEDQSRH